MKRITVHNVGILGAGRSGASEVFEAIKRHGEAPHTPDKGRAVMDITDYGEYGDTEKPPYNPKDRKRLFGEDES